MESRDMVWRRIAALARLLCVAGGLLAGFAHAAEWRDSPEVARLFAEARAEGTFVLYDLCADRFTGFDRARAETRFVPASTFKIANSLIGLATGAVSGVDEVLPYGGKPQPFPAWERDMGLREAIGVSNVPIYQELARRVGLAAMAENVARLDYGNGDIGGVVDRFWLAGPLEISAVEQARFLARLLRNQLPFPIAVQAQVRAIVPAERGEGWELAGKTGWATERAPRLGWWVGWVKNGEHWYSFALNMDIARAEDLPRRVELGKAALRALGVLPETP